MNLCELLYLTFSQIPLAEVENVRDMNNELIASDVQKASLPLDGQGLDCPDRIFPAGFLKRFDD